MPLLDDWVVQLQFDESKVDQGIKNLDKKFDKLERTRTQKMEKRFPNALIKAEVEAHKMNARLNERAAKQRIKDRVNLHKIDTRLSKQARAQSAKPASTGPLQKTNLTRLSGVGRIGVEDRILKQTARAQSALAAIEGKSDKQSIDLKNRLQKEVRRLNAAQSRLDKIVFTNTKAYEGLARSLKTNARNMQVLERNTKDVTKRFNAQRFAINGLTQSLRNMARSYLSVFAVLGAASAVGGIITNIESIKASMLAATGSAEEAAKAFARVSTISFALGTDLQAGAKGYQQIGTAARAAGLGIEDTNDLFLAAAEGSVAFGLSTEDQQGVLRAFTQILGKGNVQMEELRGQLGDRLPGAVQLAAKAMGVTVEQLNEMVRRGEVASDEFLPKFAAELRNSVRESGALSAGMDTTRAAFGRLKTAFSESLTAASEDEVGGLAESLDILAVAMKDLEPIFRFLIKGFTTVARVISVVVRLVTKLFDAIGISTLFGALNDFGLNLLGGLENLTGNGPDEVEQAKRAVLNRTLVGGGGTSSTSNSNTNVVYNNTFNTTSDPQEIARTMNNQVNWAT